MSTLESVASRRSPVHQLTSAHLEHPAVRGWAESVMAERKQLWEERGRGEEEQAQLGGAKVGEIADAKAAKAKADSASK